VGLDVCAEWKGWAGLDGSGEDQLGFAPRGIEWQERNDFKNTFRIDDWTSAEVRRFGQMEVHLRKTFGE